MRLKPRLQGALLTLAGEALVLIAVWVFIGLRLGIWSYIEYTRYVWLTANLPVARLLWHGDVKAGDDVKQLAKACRPHLTSTFDRWVELRWVPGGPSPDSISFTGICVTARDGRLVSASSYADDGVLDRVFFDTLTPTERADYEAAHEAHFDKLQAQRQHTTQ